MKNYIILTSILLLCIQYNVFSNRKIDSLTKLLTSEKNRENVDIMNKLSVSYRGEDILLAQHYATKALDVAKTINYQHGIARSEMNIGVCKSIKGRYFDAIRSFEIGLEIFKTSNNKLGIAEAFIALGRTYYNLGSIQESLIKYQKALLIYREIDNSSGLCVAYNNLGIAYDELGDYSTALEYYLKSLSMKKERNDPRGLMSIYTNIGVIYWKMHNYDKAEEYYNIAMGYIETVDAPYLEANIYTNKSILLRDRSKYKEAIDYEIKSLKITKVIGDNYSMAISYLNIGSLYNDIGKYSKAKLYLDSALVLSTDMNDDIGIVDSYYYYGMLALNKKEFNVAIEHFDKASKKYKELKKNKKQILSLTKLAYTYSLIGKYDKAYEIQKELSIIRDSVNKYDNLRSIKAITARNDLETEIIKMEYNAKLQKAHIKKLYIILSGSFLLLIVITSSYTLMRKKNKEIYKINEQLLMNQDFNQLTYSRLKNDFWGALFHLSYSIFSVKNKDDYNKLNTSYEQLGKVYNRILNSYSEFHKD